MKYKIFYKETNILKKQNKNTEKLLKKEDGYYFKLDSMIVKIVYAKNNKSFNKCMLNILNDKMKIS